MVLRGLGREAERSSLLASLGTRSVWTIDLAMLLHRQGVRCVGETSLGLLAGVTLAVTRNVYHALRVRLASCRTAVGTRAFVSTNETSGSTGVNDTAVQKPCSSGTSWWSHLPFGCIYVFMPHGVVSLLLLPLSGQSRNNVIAHLLDRTLMVLYLLLLLCRRRCRRRRACVQVYVRHTDSGGDRGLLYDRLLPR